MSAQLLLARQPILDVDKAIFGYEFFYRNADGSSLQGNSRQATSSVLVNLLNQLGLRKGVGEARAFINVNSDVLLTDILDNLPADSFVFEISQTMVMTHREIDAIADLHKRGYLFALDNVTLNDAYYDNFKPIFPYVSYAKFDTMMTDMDQLASHIDRYKAFTLIAQKVEFTEIYEAYKALGFTYFQGYFFAKPSLIQQNRIDPKHLGVLQLFNLMQQETPTDQIVAIFQKHNELSLQLMQFANSTGLFAQKNSSSIRDIIESLGTKKLQQWLMMILFSKSAQSIDNDKSSYSLTIQKRIDLMLELMKLTHPNDVQRMEEKVRFLCFMSMLEAVFNTPLATIFENFHVSDDVRDALETNTGSLGRLYALTLSIERSDFAAAQILLKPLKINIDDLVDVIEEHIYT
jgi:EAL and modified HD-GYP domain-containing signal transduction protein